MKLDDFKLTKARPQDMQPNVEFIDKVMDQLTVKSGKRLSQLFRRSPLVTAIVAIVVLIVVTSGAAYAVSYLWPQLYSNISSPRPSSSGRVSVLATNCDHIDTTKQYELKKDAPVSSDKLAEVVKAQCELNAVSDWANKTYQREPSNDPAPDNKPGSVQKHVTITPAGFVVQYVKAEGDKIVIRNNAGSTYTVGGLSSDTKVIIGGQYSTLSRLSPNDAIALVSQDTTTTKNRADCTLTSCQADITASSEKILAVVKLTYSFDIYQAISSLNERPTCTGNPKDECPSTSSIDLYEHLGELRGNYAQITGRITSYDDKSITLVTSSGRRVIVSTPWNIVDRFNTEKSANYELTVALGDMVSIDYDQAKNATNDSTIAWERIMGIKLLMEATNKAGPYSKY